jgi:glycosyltransferase involved in cell wall biosynthesis
MKLIVQIPCYNEEHTLPQTLADIPRRIEGIDVVEILIIDDGSRDGTLAVARAHGVHHIIVNKRNIGLARSFKRGLDAALAHGADIIVNTDGDNQYCGADIPKLIRPILEGRADVVIGDRQTASIEHFSSRKKMLQRFGSSVVRQFSGVDVPDAVSGFRAISRDAARSMNIVSGFSYTIEMLIQVGRKGWAFESVPIRTNGKTRESRLFASIGKFIERSGTTLLRMYTMYSPLRVFTSIGMIMAVVGVIPIAIFVTDYFLTGGSGRVQSLVIGAALLTIGSITFLLGLLADLINFNRQLIEMTLEKVRRLEEHAAATNADAEMALLKETGVQNAPRPPAALQKANALG